MQTIELVEEVCIAYARITELEPDEFDYLELASLGGVVAKRRREFQAGRRLARCLLKTNGYTPMAIPLGKNRLPEWPQGVIASISHTDTLVAVALARSLRIQSLGLDIERVGAVTPELGSSLLLPSELLALDTGGSSLTEYFSAKEATFKACFPLHNEYYEFTDIEVELEAGGFRAQPSTGLASAETVAHGRGFHTKVDDHVVSLFIAEGDT